MKRWWPWGRAKQEAIPENAWAACARLSLLRRYGPEEQARLRALAGLFLRRKEICGAGELTLTESMRYSVAAQASVPILNLGMDWYDGWHTVIVYAGDFVARHEYMDEAGVVHEVREALSGESWEHGPVLLSWEEVDEAGRGEGWGNVVIHEFAHKLDLLNGSVNGMPPLHADMDRPTWTSAFEAAFDDMTRRVAAGVPTPIDDYAAEDSGEFFAVASEAFFVHPGDLREAYARVYAQLSRFYRQDPAAREAE